MKHILIATGLYPPEVGGPASYTALLEKELPKKGFIVFVLAFKQVRHFPVVFRHVIFGLKMMRLLLHRDAVFTQDPMTAGVASIATLIIRKPFYARVTGDYAWEQGRQRFGVTSTLDDFYPQKEHIIVRIFSSLQGFAFRRATTVIVPSAYLKKIILKWGVEEKKIKVIYNAVDIPELPLRDVIRTELLIEGKCIFSAGRFVPWKHFDLIIRAVHQLPDQHVRLIIAGDGPEKNALFDLAHQLDMSRRVIFTGNLSREVILKYIKAADVFVLNSSYEGMSHMLIEAVLLGTPIVASRVGGNPEVLQDYSLSTQVNPHDSKQLMNAITQILDKKISDREREKASLEKREQFDSKRLIADLSNIFV